MIGGRAAALAVGGGYELFGRFCRPGSGGELPGAGLFDTWTLRSRAVLGGQYGTITEARADRAIGELAVRWNGRLLVGFENHAGATYLGRRPSRSGRSSAGAATAATATRARPWAAPSGPTCAGPACRATRRWPTS